jgi:hypothetical protein
MNLEISAKQVLRAKRRKQIVGGLGAVMVFAVVGWATYWSFPKDRAYALNGQFDGNPASLVQTYDFPGFPAQTATDGETYDSDHPSDTKSSVLKLVADVVRTTFDAWNRRDVARFVAQYVQTNDLTIALQLLSHPVDHGMRFTGRDTFLKECATYASDPSLMGHWEVKQMKIRMLTSSVAYAVISMHAEMPRFKTDAIDSLVLIQTPAGWKIAADTTQTEN